MHGGRLNLVAAASVALLALLLAQSILYTMRQEAAVHVDGWRRVGIGKAGLPSSGGSTQQTASLVLDIDSDGLNDFVIGARKEPGPSMVWYRRRAGSWDRYLIDAQALDIEAGGTFFDIDADGDPDIVMGGDSRSNQVWWWENPHPNHQVDQPWVRRLVKDGGENQHHDQLFGDFDGDGRTELVFWNQGAQSLLLAEIPPDPRDAGPWPLRTIYTWRGSLKHEGLAAADMDGDGNRDIVGGGRWFKHIGDGKFQAFVIDEAMAYTRVAVGQLISGGRPEVVLAVGDGVGPLRWYQWRDGGWVGEDLLPRDVDHGHSLQLVDCNRDGKLDIFNAEMRLHGRNEDARARLLLGDGHGGFTPTVLNTGFGHHESRMADLDGDGDLDLLGKPYDWQTPRLDIWINDSACGRDLEHWHRHVIDARRPDRAVFIDAADLNGDQLPDIVAGGWWYRNPAGRGTRWVRRAIGEPLNNMALLHDFDRDGDVDILGTQGKGSRANPRLVWARNDGQGHFTVLDNIDPGEGDFLQGAAVARRSPDGPMLVFLSWHAGGNGVQALRVPENPSAQRWIWQRISAVSQDEQVSAGDIDRDGDLDLLLGTRWLRNDGERWTPLVLHDTEAMPDRNRLVDMDGDGRLDAVVGYESTDASPMPLAWYAQPANASERWTEHLIATPVAPMSLDVRDMDGDGDQDVVVGEHQIKSPSSARLLLYQNLDGKGRQWRETVISIGDEHHDGARVIDLDRDGDLDVISIGWRHHKVLFYENCSPGCLPVSGSGLPLSPEQ